MKKILSYLFIFIVFNQFFTSCKKEDEFLSAKPDVSLVVPSKLEDYQLLLYREQTFNQGSAPALGTATTDEYWVTPSYWDICPVHERNTYILGKGDIYESDLSITDWNVPYVQIYYANTVLEGIEKVAFKAEQKVLYDQIKGQALFFRALAFYNLVQTFALPYDSITAAKDPGIILRLTSDFNGPVKRSTIQESYDQILQDLSNALALLPNSTPLPTQPSKVAGNALFARIYLGLRDYSKAFTYSDATLAMNNTLTDYNSLTPTSTYLSTSYLKEDIFQAGLNTKSITGFGSGGTSMDSVLYAMYDNPNDLRKTTCYIINSGRIEWRGSYMKSSSQKYCGLATNEMYLIRAECLARRGNTSGAMNDLNTLLRTRWKKNGTVSTYVDQTATSSTAALNVILRERRKELVFRGLRWTDIRRLNMEPGFQTTLVRVFNGITYTLPPGDPRFAMPIPTSEIKFSGVAQNIR
jgi:tetratricopeptide (TPR) repeat protein